MRLISVVPLCLAALAAAAPPDVSDYNITWRTPGPDASASMPIGNGEVGLNVWTEPSGDVLFYISRTDSWSEASRLLKLGRIRISLSPGLAQPGQLFKQELDLKRGCIRLTGGPADKPTTLTIFVDAAHPVIHVVGAAASPTDVKVSLECWRNDRKRLTGRGPDAELTSSWTMHDAPDSIEVKESADSIVDDGKADRLTWCHHNEWSVVPLSIKHQGLESIASSIADPLIHRTFGGTISVTGSQPFRKSVATFQSAAPVTSFEVKIKTACQQSVFLTDWLAALDEVGAGAPDDAAQARTEAWWAGFWSRSSIFIEGDRAQPGAGVPANRHPITLAQDSAGGNRFRGEIKQAAMYVIPRDAAGIEAMARRDRDALPLPEKMRLVSFKMEAKPGATAPDSAAQRFPDGFTAEAWIKPVPDLHSARIIDKVTPGQPDGFLFDIQPDATLRLIVGAQILTAPRAVKLGEWNHVAATYDPAADRLCLFVGGKQVAASSTDDSPTPSLITRGYILQRWMQACGWGGDDGEYPIKFNGSIFTVDAKYTNGVDASPDYRRWGDCFWWQNTRLPYHPMLASGDFEMMDPLFRMYRNALPACEARAKLYHTVSGAYFPETMTLNGLYSNGDYGWDRKGHEPSEVQCPWWQYAWNQGTELVSLMLDRYDYTQDEAFAREQLVPMATSILQYFDTRFKRDSKGKLVISPTQSIETYWKDVINDMPAVAGLHDITPRLLALPASIGSPEDRALWKRLDDALPPIPTRTEGSVRLFSAAEKYDPRRSNCETPELYNVFPHRLVGLDSAQADIDAARETYRRRHDKATHGWTQDGQFAALLGMTDEAKANILAKARNSSSKHRFPAMWGPNFDWLPDQCHGSNLMHVLQCLLLQPRGDKILLLPAWPKEWNVSFRLHAPKSTVVECEYRDGRVVRLRVTPESRRADVQVMLENK